MHAVHTFSSYVITFSAPPERKKKKNVDQKKKKKKLLYSRFQVNGDWRAVCAQAFISSRHLVQRLGLKKPRSCCLRGLVLKPPVRLPGPLPNPETWRRTAPKRMDKWQNWTRWPLTMTSPSRWTWSPRSRKRICLTGKHGGANLTSSCRVWVMQLDWGTCGDFPISVERTVEVNTLFSLLIISKRKTEKKKLHERPVSCAHSRAYLIGRVDWHDRE